MSSTAVALVLLAACLHAGWNTVLKVGGDRLVVLALINGCAGLIAACLLPFAPFPDRAAWPNIAASTVLHAGYNLFLAASTVVQAPMKAAVPNAKNSPRGLIRAAGSPHGYALTLFALDGLVFLLLVLWRRGAPALAAAARREWRGTLGAGLMCLVGYWLVIWALTLAPAATVAALRETSVVIAALLGTVLLKEPLGAWRVTAAAVVAVGAVMLRF